MILQAYFDDSEKNGYYAVGGYIAPLTVWRRWNSLWYAELKQKAPKLGFFRSSEPLAMKGAFEHFTDAPQRDSRILALAETLPTENFFRVHAHVKLDQFKEFFSSKVPSPLTDPFYLCAFYLVTHLNLSLLTNKPLPSTVDYFFDRQGKVGPHFVEVSDFSAVTTESDLFPFIGDFRFENKEEFLGLQAADMCVSWTRRRASRDSGVLASDVIVEKQRHLSYPIEPDFLGRMADTEHMTGAARVAFARAAEILQHWKRA
jgi:hypothetical protein